MWESSPAAGCPKALSPILQYGKIVTKLGYDARFQDFKVQNIVGSTDVKFPIRLEGLAYSHAVFASVSTLYIS